MTLTAFPLSAWMLCKWQTSFAAARCTLWSMLVHCAAKSLTRRCHQYLDVAGLCCQIEQPGVLGAYARVGNPGPCLCKPQSDLALLEKPRLVGCWRMYLSRLCLCCVPLSIISGNHCIDVKYLLLQEVPRTTRLDASGTSIVHVRSIKTAFSGGSSAHLAAHRKCGGGRPSW